MKTKLLLLRTALGLAGALASASPFAVNYDFAGEPGDQTSTAGTSTSLLVSGPIVDRGPGIGATSAGNSISSNGWDALDPSEDYFSFRFEVDSGYFANITNLKIGTRSSNTGPGDLGLVYSGDNFTSTLYTFTQSGINFLNSDIQLNLANLTDEVEFRIIALSDTRADGATGITSGGTFRIVNYFAGGDTGGITFSGTLEAIPEPSVALMALLGIGILAKVMRRKTQ
ncbi:MAG: PEP-CTERM sorting domain-containing protein [Verrucomicrobia bacterium]|nr:PEP-CTERM sorting domain-containing protein [Verrucomicrobiota bacterium]MCH8512606.1 PEP-CTERM sorting domain-containing protein [Kiritimatiellia bacterium]